MVQPASERVVNGIKTRVLHGKDYVEVAERLRILHAANKEFEVIESQPFEVAGRFVWRCVALIDGKRFVGNAEVKLDAPRGTVDATNPFENAETSALGRLLAFAGLGTVESIASLDEVVRAISIREASGVPVIEGSVQRQLPPAQTGQTEISPTIQRMIDIARNRAEKLSLTLEDVKRESGVNVPDTELVATSFVKINGWITKAEQELKSSTAGAGR